MYDMEDGALTKEESRVGIVILVTGLWVMSDIPKDLETVVIMGACLAVLLFLNKISE